MTVHCVLVEIKDCESEVRTFSEYDKALEFVIRWIDSDNEMQQTESEEAVLDYQNAKTNQEKLEIYSKARLKGFQPYFTIFSNHVE